MTTKERSIDEKIESLHRYIIEAYPSKRINDLLDEVLLAERQKREEMVAKRNGVIKEYKDDGVMFILKVEDGKTYEASMPIPKWAEVGNVELRITQPNK